MGRRWKICRRGIPATLNCLHGGFWKQIYRRQSVYMVRPSGSWRQSQRCKHSAHNYQGRGRPNHSSIFNRAEFHLYGRGVILEPDLPCLMCYKNDFDENCRITNCMDLIQADSISEKVDELVQAS